MSKLSSELRLTVTCHICDHMCSEQSGKIPVGMAGLKNPIGDLLGRGNLVPRSHSVTGNVRSGKVRFRACSVPARPEIRAFL